MRLAAVAGIGQENIIIYIYKESGNHAMEKGKEEDGQRWIDDIRKIGGETWPRKARDRNEWKQLEEAYVSQDTLITEPENQTC
ncbi:unnamed protein product, partial [Brenthis ino]